MRTATPDQTRLAREQIRQQLTETVVAPVECGCDLLRDHGQAAGVATAHARLLAIERTGTAGLAELVRLVAFACSATPEEAVLEPLYAAPLRSFADQHAGRFNDVQGVRHLLTEIADLAESAYQEPVELQQARVTLQAISVLARADRPAVEDPRTTLDVSMGMPDTSEGLLTVKETASRLEDLHRYLRQQYEAWGEGDDVAGESFCRSCRQVDAIAQRLAEAPWTVAVAEWCDTLAGQLREALGLLLSGDEEPCGMLGDVDEGLELVAATVKELWVMVGDMTRNGEAA